MSTWNFEKQAGLILDQQDDPGVGWNNDIQPFWPQDMREPDVGIDKEAEDCVVDLQSDDGQTKVAKYPIGTPEDALASSMYFLAHGRDAIEKEAHEPIARNLKQARLAHSVDKLSDQFLRHISQSGMGKEASQDETYADDTQNLPVTTPDQCKSSIHVFQKHASDWASDDRMVIARKLQHAADRHGVDADLDLSNDKLAKSASRSLKRRMRVMEGLDNHPNHVAYMEKIKSMKNDLPDMDDYRSILKSASELEEMDKEARFDNWWNDAFPDPARTFVDEYETDPLKGLEKDASPDWAKMWKQADKDSLNIKEAKIQEIEQDPEQIVPTLPKPLKDQIREAAT